MIYLLNLLHILKLHTTAKQEVDARLQESFALYLGMLPIEQGITIVWWSWFA